MVWLLYGERREAARGEVVLIDACVDRRPVFHKSRIDRNIRNIRQFKIRNVDSPAVSRAHASIAKLFKNAACRNEVVSSAVSGLIGNVVARVVTVILA